MKLADFFVDTSCRAWSSSCRCVSVAPAGLSHDVDAVAFFHEGDYAVGHATDPSFSVRVPADLGKVEVQNTASAFYNNQESTLLLADLEAADSGAYHVVVSNRAGTETSDTVTLTVEIQGPETRPILTVVGVTIDGLKLSVTGDAGTEYDLQFSIDLKSWSTLAKVSTDDTGKAVYTDSASAEVLAKETWIEATGFYRAVLAVGDGGE